MKFNGSYGVKSKGESFFIENFKKDPRVKNSFPDFNRGMHDCEVRFKIKPPPPVEPAQIAAPGAPIVNQEAPIAAPVDPIAVVAPAEAN